MKLDKIILGGGMTGLAAGMSSGFPVFEGKENPGGICSSYYLNSKNGKIEFESSDEEAYRFEIGGGHWIFGNDPFISRLIGEVVPMKKYNRISGVWFADTSLYVPYPIQNNLSYLPKHTASSSLNEIVNSNQSATPIHTMQDWLLKCFGNTLSELFFFPFHELYTAGLYKKIATQDAYKSPININQVINGALTKADSAGYNVSYLYPQNGLNSLSQCMAKKCDIRYGKKIDKIHVKDKVVVFEDNSFLQYEKILSTLPLNKMMQITELDSKEQPDPYTSVLVLNIGAEKGANLPEDHWLYHPHTKSGFHRTGIYSNVDISFVPYSSRQNKNKVSLYIEKAYLGGTPMPAGKELENYINNVVGELQSWGFIKDVEVIDPTWIEVAYTWSLPGSQWKNKSLELLEKQDIFMVGRYGRWVFQGILDSIKDGFFTGSVYKNLK